MVCYYFGMDTTSATLTDETRGEELLKGITFEGATWEYPGWLSVPCGSAPYGFLSFGFVNGTLGADDGDEQAWDSGKLPKAIRDQGHAIGLVENALIAYRKGKWS